MDKIPAYIEEIYLAALVHNRYGDLNGLKEHLKQCNLCGREIPKCKYILDRYWNK